MSVTKTAPVRGNRTVTGDQDAEAVTGTMLVAWDAGRTHPRHRASLDAIEVTQQELAQRHGPIMRELDESETFVVTRNPVGELTPLHRPLSDPAAGNRGGSLG